jgi:hypothetical protein
MDCFVASLLAMTTGMPPRSRRAMRSSCCKKSFAQQRAWGMPGARCTRSRAWSVVSTRVSHHGRTETPGIPARNGFNSLFRALPGDRACLPPSSAEMSSANLTPASGRQDHTTSPSADKRSRQQRRLRPSHPLPYVRDDRETPLVFGPGCERHGGDLGQKKTQIFLRGGLDS